MKCSYFKISLLANAILVSYCLYHFFDVKYSANKCEDVVSLLTYRSISTDGNPPVNVVPQNEYNSFLASMQENHIKVEEASIVGFDITLDQEKELRGEGGDLVGAERIIYFSWQIRCSGKDEDGNYTQYQSFPLRSGIRFFAPIPNGMK